MSDINIKTRPVIKWAGGKTQLLETILPMVPEFNTYYEPFFGGGALFFALAPKKACLNDLNTPLISLYDCIRKQPEDLMLQLDELERKHGESEGFYYEARKMFNILRQEIPLL